MRNKGLCFLISVLALLSFASSTGLANRSPWSWKDKNIPSCGQEPIRTNMSIRLGAYMYVFDNLTEEVLRFAGTHFDIFSYNHIHFDRNSTEKLREYNPAICLLLTFCPLILDESNASLLNVGGWNSTSMNSWVLRTSNGQEAPNPLWSFGNTHFMDIGNRKWAAYFRDRANMWVDLMGADGYFIDGVPWNGVYYPDPSQLPQYNSARDINDAIVRFLDAIRSPHHCLVLDDVTQPSQQDHLDGVWGEDWLGYDSTVPWGSSDVKRWEEAVENLERYSAQKKPYIAQGWYHYGNTKELEYLAGTYLIGKMSNSATFQPCPVGSPALIPDAPYDFSSYQTGIYDLELREHPEIFDIDLGASKGGRLRFGTGFWVRVFSKGLVFVNPSNTESRSIQLDGAMEDVNGSSVTQIQLGPRSAAILRGPEPVTRGLRDLIGNLIDGLNESIEDIRALGGNVTYYQGLVENLYTCHVTDTNLSTLLNLIQVLTENLTRAKADAFIAEAERLIMAARAQGIDTTRHELFLKGAKRSFEEGNYESVETLCQYPLRLREQIPQGLGAVAILLLVGLRFVLIGRRCRISWAPGSSTQR